MKLMLRDDDLSYFTKVSQIEFAYGDIWDRIPINFAVIPNVGLVSGAIPMQLCMENKNENYPIAMNKELVYFLKTKIKEGKVKIYQHGLTHKNYDGKFEMERRDLGILARELAEGKKLLEKAFNIEIDTIVAPHDRFSREAISAAEKVGYKYISRGMGPLPREIQFNRIYLKSFLKIYKNYFRNRNLCYPKILDFGKHKEIFNYRIQCITKKNIEDIIKNSNLDDGVLAITVHYRSINLHQKEMINFIVGRINNSF
ncbi:MAG: DUF2334 domain-containing protein [Parcubacteria group bacterium]|jgi:hypothetical protein